MSKSTEVVGATSQEEAKKKAEAFLKEYGELVEKHKMDFANYPIYMPDGQGAFKTVIQCTPVSTSNLSKPSPFMGK